MSKRGVRNYCFTFNNWTKEGREALEKCEIFTYVIFGEEIAPTTGTPHLQGYFEMKDAKTMDALHKKYLPKGVALIEARGDSTDNKKYCSKDAKNIYERGTPKNQGKRTDIEKVRDEIIAGKSVDNICLENPMFYHQYGRTLHKIEDICLRKKYRKWMTTCDWYYGPTGIGKSYTAFKDFNPETHYVWKDDNGWQDGYTGQETVIINEFRGSIAYSKLLDLIDENAYYVNRRGREPAPFIAKHIIITSALSPSEVYHNLSENDRLEQLHRRVKTYYKAKREDEWQLILY